MTIYLLIGFFILIFGSIWLGVDLVSKDDDYLINTVKDPGTWVMLVILALAPIAWGVLLPGPTVHLRGGSWPRWLRRDPGLVEATHRDQGHRGRDRGAPGLRARSSGRR